MEVIHKLCVNNVIELPDLIICIRDLVNRAIFTFRLCSKILPDPFAMRAIKLRIVDPAGDECFEVCYVFFFPS